MVWLSPNVSFYSFTKLEETFSRLRMWIIIKLTSKTILVRRARFGF